MRRINLRRVPAETARQLPQLRALSEAPLGVPIVQLFFQLIQVVHVRYFDRPALQLQAPSRVEAVLAVRALLRMAHATFPAVLAGSDGALANLNFHHCSSI